MNPTGEGRIPCSLIDEFGKPTFGIYYQPIETINDPAPFLWTTC